MNPRLVVALVILAILVLGTAVMSLLEGGNEGTSGPSLGLGGSAQETEIAQAPPHQSSQLDSVEEPPTTAREAAPTQSNEDPMGSLAPVNAGPATGQLEGRVLNAEGVGLANAEIALVEQLVPPHLALLAPQTGRAPAPPRTTQTDERGYFTIAKLRPGNQYAVTARHAEYASKRIHPLQIRPEGVSNVDIQLDRGLRLFGTVTDQAGNPLDGAMLVLIDQLEAHLPGDRKPSEQLIAHTDTFGNYEIVNVAPGTRNLTCRLEGFGSQTINNLIFNSNQQETEKNLRLGLGHCIEGVVLGPDRAPVEGVYMEAVSYQTAMSSKGVTWTDADGQFSICDLNEGTYVLIARREGFSEVRENRIEAGDGNVMLEMYRQGAVSGQVLANATGELVDSFRISVRQVSANSQVYGRAFRSQEFQDPDGRFTVHGLEAGTYVLQAMARGFAPTFSDSFVVAQGIETPDVVVRMTMGGRITGRVVDAMTREPVANASIATFDNNYVENPFTELLAGVIPRMTADVKARTDEDGVFELSGLNPEVYQLQVSHPEFTRNVLLDQRVADGQNLDLGTVLMRRGAVLTGTVYDSAGQPLANSDVQMNAASSATGVPTQMYRTMTDARGRYEFRNVAEGSYRVTATRGGGQTGNPFEKIIDMKNSETAVTVIEGQETVQDLYLGSG